MRFAYGLDLGQITDPTGHVVVERVDQFKDEIVDRSKVTWRPALIDPIIMYQVRHIDRDLGVKYNSIARKVRQLMQTPILWKETDLVVDATGVGMPVVEMLRLEGLEPIPVVIHGGQAVSFNEDTGVYTVPKRDLAIALALVVESRRIQIIDNPMGYVLRREAYGFRAKVSEETGNTKFIHREGEHDDTLLALAMAVWWQELAIGYGRVPEPDYQESRGGGGRM